MKSLETSDHEQLKSATTLHTLVLPRLPERILRLVSGAYATHGGAEHMTLDEWRDLEQQLKRKLRR